MHKRFLADQPNINEHSSGFNQSGRCRVGGLSSLLRPANHDNFYRLYPTAVSPFFAGLPP